METFLAYSFPIVVLLPFFGAAVAFYASRINRVASAWSAGITTILSIALLMQSASAPFAGKTLVQSWSWFSQLGLDFAFRLDGLSLLFACIILFIGLLIIIYARYYLSPKDCMGRFFMYLMLFMGSMLGIVMSENIILMVVFWEMTSLSSFLLISYWTHRKDARAGARMALAITGGGGLALLAGALLLGDIVGSYSLSVVLESRELIISHPLYTLTLVLMLIGAFAKSAQFPFHFWLPHAMAAPTPVSAYLHSATMVKAGIFLMARFFPVFSGTVEWTVIVSTVGMATLLLGAISALFKHDLKGLLAYSTISHLGLITLLFGFGTKLAAVAAIFHIINHATFKASLFMVAGIIDHETGTRDMRRLNGLLKYMPHTATLAMIAAAAMAGVPLLNGFLSKEMFFQQALSAADSSIISYAVPILATVAGIFSVAYSIRFIHDVFFDTKEGDMPKTPHEPPRFMKIPVDLLVVICLAVGIVPALTVHGILAVAVADTLHGPLPEYSLAIWHGFNIPLLMSAIALIGGFLVYRYRKSLFAMHERYLEPLDARVAYSFVIEKIVMVTGRITALFDRDSLQTIITWTLITALLFGGYGFLIHPAPLFGSRELMDIDLVTLLGALLLMGAALYTVKTARYRIVSLIAIGVVGLFTSITFVRYSAPDLALTQLSVEVVTTTLLLLALYYLPQRGLKERGGAKKVLHTLLATLSGVGATILTFSVLSRDFETISDFFLKNSVPGGGGTNVVNVILVDFRGYDTLGEIVVLGLAGLGIFGLFHTLGLKAREYDEYGRPWSPDMHPPIMQTLTRLLFPLMLVVAIYIFLRGHNLPGGGFIAGLIAAIAIAVQYLSNGIEWTGQRIKADMHKVIGMGLMIAVITGLIPMFLGHAFLTSAFTYLNWPVVGKFEVASAIGFDPGVFLVVVGATVLILVQIGRISFFSHKKLEQGKGK